MTFKMAGVETLTHGKLWITANYNDVITRDYEQLVFPRKKTLQIRKTVLALSKMEDGRVIINSVVCVVCCVCSGARRQP